MHKVVKQKTSSYVKLGVWQPQAAKLPTSHKNHREERSDEASTKLANRSMIV